MDLHGLRPEDALRRLAQDGRAARPADYEALTADLLERKAINEIIPFYVESMIPAGTYEAIQYDVPTVAVNGLFVTSADQPDDRYPQRHVPGDRNHPQRLG